jgi:hypothetical protein
MLPVRNAERMAVQSGHPLDVVPPSEIAERLGR